MRTILAPLMVFYLLMACQGRKADITTDGDIDSESFIASFKPFQPPFRMTDTELAKEPGDSLLISAALMNRFFPDSVFSGDFPRGSKVRFHAIGAHATEEAESYLLLRATSSGKTMAYLLCFDADNNFRAALPVLRLPSPKGGAEMLIEKNLSIHVYRGKPIGVASNDVKRDVYVYNNAGLFTLVMSENTGTAEDSRDIYNPIDSLPSKNPMSGDYVRNGRDFISVRDARLPDRLHFFVHMEREEGECLGELRGELDIVKPGLARYSKADDHCSMDFVIRSGTLTVRELSLCGNHRSVKCAFEGSYRRKRPALKSTK
jgi:hypothetical protein